MRIEGFRDCLVSLTSSSSIRLLARTERIARKTFCQKNHQIHNKATKNPSNQTGCFFNELLCHILDFYPLLSKHLTVGEQFFSYYLVHHVDHISALFRVLLAIGNGNFTFSLAQNCDLVTAVELSRNGIFCLRKGLQENKIQNANAIKAECLIFVRKAAKRKEEFDIVILDPPRTGCKPIIPYLKDLNVKKVVYVSCSIRSLARDITLFKKQGS